MSKTVGATEKYYGASRSVGSRLTPETSAEVVEPILTLKNSAPQKQPIQYYVKYSFTITYILLLTTATITFIEALRTNIPAVRHVLNLETCVSIVAGYFYSLFIAKIDLYQLDNSLFDWNEITKMRYVDWSITTPMMLLALCLVLSMNTNTTIHITTFLPIILLNYFMLYLGYLGEISVLTKLTAMMIGFIAFLLMFYIIFIMFVRPKYNYSNYVLYGIYLTVWSMYGIVYMFNEEYKNIAMNALDCTAKCLIGLGLWIYYTKIIQL